MRDLFASAEMPAVAVAPNEHGVYSRELAESIVLAGPKKGRMPLAEIDLLNVAGTGWLMATHLFLPDYGSGEPITGRRPYHDREEALAAAIARLRRKAEPQTRAIQHSEAHRKLAKQVAEWLETVA